jgi:hypothetical protein
MIIADLPTREKRAGTTSMMESMPYLKRHFLLLKLATGLVLVFLFSLIPLARLIFHNTSAALSLVIGSFFVVSCAIGLGMVSGNPKAFMVAFFLFFYVVMNDSGKTPGFDFAGWFGTATPSVQGLYLILSVAMLSLAMIAYRLQQRYR